MLVVLEHTHTRAHLSFLFYFCFCLLVCLIFEIRTQIFQVSSKLYSQDWPWTPHHLASASQLQIPKSSESSLKGIIDLCVCDTGDWTKDLMNSRQNPLSRAISSLAFLLFWDKVSLSCPYWPQTHNPPVSACKTAWIVGIWHNSQLNKNIDYES